MPERPLVLFAAPTVADKERRYGGASKYYLPSHSRQVSRLTPQFNVLQHTINSGNIYFTNYATGVDPEYTLVFETVGDPRDFYKAVNKLKEEYPTVEWLMELSDSNLNNSDDFYVMDSQAARDDSKKLTTKLFCIMTNQVALNEIISLWNHYQTDENFKFPRGMAGFKQLFRTLYDVHKWGIEERLEDTGLIEIWEEELQDRYLGYGEPDVERVKECTKEQVTLIGFGDIAQDKAFVYSIPIPIEFHEKSLKRKLTVTLAYLSPIHPSSIKYREKQVWVTINNGNSLIGSRAEYDYHAVQRGTLQHEIFENDSIEVWDIDQSIELKVNCRGCASENNPEMLIPYALFATFEMAPDCGVDVYQKVVDKVQVKNAIKTV